MWEFCVATNGAMCFGAQLPFGATHFLFKKGERKTSERLEQKTSEEVTDTHEEAVTMETNNAESAETIVDNSS